MARYFSFRIEDVGNIVKQGDTYYKVVGYQSDPTVIVQNMETGEQIHHAVGCLNVQDFVRLVPEGSE